MSITNLCDVTLTGVDAPSTGTGIQPTPAQAPETALSTIVGVPDVPAHFVFDRSTGMAPVELPMRSEDRVVGDIGTIATDSVFQAELRSLRLGIPQLSPFWTPEDDAPRPLLATSACEVEGPPQDPIRELAFETYLAEKSAHRARIEALAADRESCVLERQCAVSSDEDVENMKTRNLMESHCFRSDNFYDVDISETRRYVEDLEEHYGSDEHEFIADLIEDTSHGFRQFVGYFKKGHLSIAKIRQAYSLEELIERSIPTRLIHMMSLGLLEAYFVKANYSVDWDYIHQIVSRLMVVHKDDWDYVNTSYTDDLDILGALLTYWPFKTRFGHCFGMFKTVDGLSRGYLNMLEFIMIYWPEYFEDTLSHPAIDIHEGCDSALTTALENAINCGVIMDVGTAGLLISHGINPVNHRSKIEAAIEALRPRCTRDNPYDPVTELVDYLISSLNPVGGSGRSCSSRFKS
jgi:hypothetical protein